MSDISVPHFTLPFKFVTHNGVAAAAVVEQDTLEEISYCVEATLRTHIGMRVTKPEFGITDPTFELDPVDTDTIIDEVLRSEPRANVIMAQAVDPLDPLSVRVRADVSAREDKSA